MNTEELDSDEFSNKFSDYFEFKAILGKGAFGVVISAIKKTDNSEYAVKVIQKQSVSSADWDRLRQEAFILSELNHSNIVRFKDIIETERRIFLVMELVQGGQLKHLVDARRRNHTKLSDEEASTIMRSILKAVQYLHTKEIVHRDLKPENILVQDWKNLSSIKIADFGLSAQFSEDTFMKSFRQKCGTMIYMAPEQALEQQYSKPVDIWSCGLIMYILLSNGKHPLYERSDTPEKYREKLTNPVWVFGDYFTPIAQNFFLKLMHNDPVVRYTAEDALKHPWITRKFDEGIPLSAHETMASFSVEQSFSRIIKAMYMASFLTTPEEEEMTPHSETGTREDYKALVKKLSEEHQKPKTTKKVFNGGNIMVQYDALQSLLGIATANKDSPLNSQALILQTKRRDSSFFAEPVKSFSAIEENKEILRKISLAEDRVQTEGDNPALFGMAKDALIMHKEKESPTIKVMAPEEKPFANILDLPTAQQIEETDTTQETVQSFSVENKMIGLTIDARGGEMYEGMKNFLHTGMSRSTRESTKQNISLQLSYEDQGFDSDTAGPGAKRTSPNIGARKRAPSLTGRMQNSNNTSYGSEDSSEGSDSQRNQKDNAEAQKGHKKSPFFHNAQKPPSSSEKHHPQSISGDKAYPFSLIKATVANAHANASAGGGPPIHKTKSKDFTLPQIVTPKGSGTSRSKGSGSDKSFTFKSPERTTTKGLLMPQTPSGQSNKIRQELAVEPKIFTPKGGLTMSKKSFRSSNDLLSPIVMMNMKDVSSISQGRRLSTKDDLKNTNTFL